MSFKISKGQHKRHYKCPLYRSTKRCFEKTQIDKYVKREYNVITKVTYLFFTLEILT